MRRVRILHGLHWSKGGIVTFLELLLANLGSSLFEHHVAILDSDNGSTQKLKGYSKSCSCLGYDSNHVRGLFEFKRVIRELKPDVFHAHSFLPGLLGNWFCPETTARIATIHNEYPHYRHRSPRYSAKLQIEHRSLMAGFQSVVCVSESVRHLVDQAMKGLPTEVIRNGVHFQATLGSVREPKTDSLTILSLGRLDMQKGYDSLLNAFSILLKDGIDANLRIVGEGSLRTVLEKQASNLGIQDKVTLPGFSSNPASELGNADIYVCSSNYEGLSLASAEAMSCGLPFVTTRVGIARSLRDGVEALVVPVKDASALAGAIGRLIHNHDLRLRIGEAGRLFARNNLDIAKTVHSYELLYERVIHERYGARHRT